jgi:hypothetical protein
MGKMMIGLAAAAIVSAISTTGAFAQQTSLCGWVSSPLFLPGRTVYGQVWLRPCGPGEKEVYGAECEHWRYTRVITRRGMLAARWCPERHALSGTEGPESVRPS